MYSIWEILIVTDLILISAFVSVGCCVRQLRRTNYVEQAIDVHMIIYSFMFMLLCLHEVFSGILHHHHSNNNNTMEPNSICVAFENETSFDAA